MNTSAKNWRKAQIACKLQRMQLDGRRSRRDRRFFEEVKEVLLKDIKEKRNEIKQ